jgi:hypothetical protein
MFLLAVFVRPAAAQVQWRDLVVNMGTSFEGYSGNFSAVTLPIVDSAKHVVAFTGEVGARGVLSLLRNRSRSLELSLDGGMRQSAAFGFRLRDAAPREWASSASGTFSQTLGSWGSLLVEGGVRSRAVSDRPPMPLFLQPGYVTVQGSVGVVTRAFDGVTFDARADTESADYRALGLVPQDLLDRTSSGLEVGARWGSASELRFYGGLRWTEYSNQGSFDPEDPFRRDQTAQVGLDWNYVGPLLAQVGVAGTVNRSNSNRPEYDAVSVRALVTAPLPKDFSVNLFALLTAKRYVRETDFARLVPGEEADNASVAYFQIGRPLSSNLDGALRLGWTRAETDFGSAYYQRFGASMQFNYRPRGR